MVAGNVEKRSMGALGRMGVVMGVHAALILLVGRGLGIVPPLIPNPPDVLMRFIDEPRPQPDPPPRTDPQIPQIDRIQLPIPEVPPVDLSQDTLGVQLVEPDQIGIIDGPGTADPEPPVVGVRQDPRHPLSQPRYPPAETRLGNHGNVDVEVYVLPSGRVGDARVVRSSGFERLDQSAIEEAKRNWRLLPATRDGEPFAQWYKVRVTFRLTDR